MVGFLVYRKFEFLFSLQGVSNFKIIGGKEKIVRKKGGTRKEVRI